MIPTTPQQRDGEALVSFGANQPDLYLALPAAVDAQGTVTTEWELSAEDLARVLNGGRVRIALLHTGVLTGRALTPIRVDTVDAEEPRA